MKWQKAQAIEPRYQMGSAPSSIASIDAMLQSDTILPSQFYGSRRQIDDRIRGEVALWNVVLQSARRCLDGSRNGIPFKETVLWFEDVHNEAVGSLAWCCDIIGADPVAVSRLELARAARGEKLARACVSRINKVGGPAARIGYKTRGRQAEARRRLLARIAAEVSQ